VDGFSLHADAHIPASDAKRLEHLCRYIARPPFSADRLTVTPRGRVHYELRRPWRDGTTHVVFDPSVFLERLAALVPPPRAHLQTYHGVLAPASTWRDDIVPGAHRSNTGAHSATARPAAPSRRPPHRYLWAELMRRVFGLDVLRCHVCGKQGRLIAWITQQSVIVRILSHLKLDVHPPPILPARAPPQFELAFCY